MLELLCEIRGVQDPLEKAVELALVQYECTHDDESKNEIAGITAAQALLNYGIAKSVISFVVEQSATPEERDDGLSDVDDGNDSWRKGMEIVDSVLSSTTSPTMSTLAKCLKASLLCSMSQSILFPIGAENKLSAKDVPEKQLTVASQSCRDALQILDELNSTQTEHHSDHPHVQQFDALVGQALSLVASCYTIAGSAVTAQGLFQSALDKYSESSDNFLFKNIDYNPYSLMWYRDTLGRYASLCQQWEKREREAETLFGKQKELEEEHIVEGWRYQPNILSGLWFFSLGDPFFENDVGFRNSDNDSNVGDWRI